MRLLYRPFGIVARPARPASSSKSVFNFVWSQDRRRGGAEGHHRGHVVGEGPHRRRGPGHRLPDRPRRGQPRRSPGLPVPDGRLARREDARPQVGVRSSIRASGGESARFAPRAGMARPLRPLVAGGVYHVMSRGNDKAPIFLDDARPPRVPRAPRPHDRRGSAGGCFSYCLMVQPLPPAACRRRSRICSCGVQYLTARRTRSSTTGATTAGRTSSVGASSRRSIQQDAHLPRGVPSTSRSTRCRAGCAMHPADWRLARYAALVGRVPCRRGSSTSPERTRGSATPHDATAVREASSAAPRRSSTTPARRGLRRRRASAAIRCCRQATEPRRSRSVEWGDGRPPLRDLRAAAARSGRERVRSYGYPSRDRPASGLRCPRAGRWLGRYECRDVDR